MPGPRQIVEALWRQRFLRFLLVGGLNTLFGYGVFAGCVLAGLHYALAALVATVLGILFNFVTTGGLVFSSRDRSKLLPFLGVYGVNYVLGVLLMKVFKALGVHVLVTAAVLTLPMAALSYHLNRIWVFERRRPQRGDAAEGSPSARRAGP